MILNLIVLVLILLITAYLATQGLLSSLLALATSIFASVLAMALLEPLQGLIGGFRPNYARGATFLLLFLLAFSITRIVADMAVPKNIKLPVLINRAAGGVIGFFTALVVIGSLLIGVELLPLPSRILGYDRFPGDKGMQGENLGELATPSGVWFSPDRFVLTLWNGASGRGLGGAKPWTSVHPDLSVESYGYRNIVHDGSERVIPADLVKVVEVWYTDDPKEVLQRINLAKPDRLQGKRVVMVRMVVQKGDSSPHTSFDSDVNFRISASQLRLVTDKSHQYYPIGYLDQGRRFVELTLDLGRLVDDYTAPKKDAEAVVTEDWVFQVDADEKPAFVEMKQLSRTDLAEMAKEIPGSKDKPATVLPLPAVAAYPQHGWLKELCSVTVTFVPRKDSTFKAGHLYILRGEAVRKDVGSILDPAYDSVDKISKDMEKSANGWTKEGMPGVPNYNSLDQPWRFGGRFKMEQDDTPVTWQPLLQLMLDAQISPNGPRNLEELPRYMDNDVTKAWEGIKGNILVGTATADESGKVSVERLAKGRQAIIYTLLTDKGFFVWAQDPELAKSTHVTLKATADSTSSDAPIFKIDLQP